MRDTEQYLSKPLPNNNLAEKMVIGGILLDNGLYETAISILKPEHFYSPINRRIFRTMNRIALRDEISFLSINESSKEDGVEIDSTTISSYIVGLPRTNKQDFHSACVKIYNKFLDRTLIKVCNDITAHTLSEEATTRFNFERAEALIFKLSEMVYNNNNGTTPNIGFRDVGEIIPEYIEQATIGTGLSGYPTGINELDAMLDSGGLQKTAVYVFGAIPKAGKTALTLKICRNISRLENVVALIATAEMNEMSMFKRLFSPEVGLDYRTLSQKLNDEHVKRVIEFSESFKRHRIKIMTGVRSMALLHFHAQREVELARKQGFEVGCLVIDYLQLWEASTGTTGNRVSDITSVSLEIKGLAITLGIPIIAVSSLNRSSFKDGREPEMTDLRESGQIEYDAEAVGFLHNPNMVMGQEYERPDIEEILFLLKLQRNGPTGRFPLYFVGKYMDFLDREEYRSFQRVEGLMRQSDEQLEDNWNEE